MSRRKKVIISILILILLVLLGVIYYVLTIPGNPLSDEQKNKALTQILGRQPNLTDSTPKGNTTYKDEFVSFSYPASAVNYAYRDPNIKKATSVLQIFSFDISNPRLIFNYSATDYKNLSQISDVPDVRFRQIAQYGYIGKEEFANGKSGLSFQKTDDKGQIEKTAFFLINGKSFSFSVQGSDEKEVQKLYEQIIGSLKFL